MLTISPIRDNFNQKNNYRQSFGIGYLKSFRNALKGFAPSFTETEDEFILAKKAIENLASIKGRKDGLKLGTTGHPLESITDSIQYLFVKKGLFNLDGTTYDKFLDWFFKTKPEESKKLWDYSLNKTNNHIATQEQLLQNKGYKDGNDLTEVLLSCYREQKLKMERSGKVDDFDRDEYYMRSASSSQHLLDISEYLKTQEFLDNTDANLKKVTKAPKDDSCWPLFNDFDDIATFVRMRLGIFNRDNILLPGQQERIQEFRKLINKL